MPRSEPPSPAPAPPSIDLSPDGIDLLQSPHLAISGPFGWIDVGRITATPRIGLGDVGAWKDKALRFVLGWPGRFYACP